MAASDSMTERRTGGPRDSEVRKQSAGRSGGYLRLSEPQSHRTSRPLVTRLFWV